MTQRQGVCAAGRNTRNAEKLRGHATRLTDDQVARSIETASQACANGAGCTDGRHCPRGPMDQSCNRSTARILERASPRVQRRRGYLVGAAVSPRPNTVDVPTTNWTITASLLFYVALVSGEATAKTTEKHITDNAVACSAERLLQCAPMRDVRVHMRWNGSHSSGCW